MKHDRDVLLCDRIYPVCGGIDAAGTERPRCSARFSFALCRSQRTGEPDQLDEVAPNTNDATTNREISELDHRVVRYLAQNGWSRMHLEEDEEGIPNMKRCFQKNGSVIQVFKTTGRCTMNSPCTAYDGYAIIIYLPGEFPQHGQAQRSG